MICEHILLIIFLNEPELFFLYTLSGATTPDHSGPGNYGIEGVLHISQISMTGASLSDCLVSYPGTLVAERVLPPAEIQSVYSTIPVGTGLYFYLIIAFRLFSYMVSTV